MDKQMSQEKKPKTETRSKHHAVFVNCTKDEQAMIQDAAILAGFERSISTWARGVLLVEARKVIKKHEGG